MMTEMIKNLLDIFESRIHEKLENLKKKSAMVPYHAALLFCPGSRSTQCNRQSRSEVSCNDLTTEKVSDGFEKSTVCAVDTIEFTPLSKEK